MVKRFWRKTKLIWILINTFVLTILIYVLKEAWINFSSNSLLTVLNDPLHPILDVDFPIITICSTNRLSKKAVTEYAIELTERDLKGRNITYFMEKIKLLSYLYGINSIDGIDINEFISFEKYLVDSGDNERNVKFDSYEIFKRLTPKCENLLINCKIGGNNIACSDIIQPQISEYGICCTLNISNGLTLQNIKSVFDEDYLFKSSDTGLTLVINSSTIDNYYTLLNTQDNTIHIYTKNKYDDGSSGGIIEKFIAPGEETYIRIIPKYLVSDDEVQKYAIERRKCMFVNEVPNNKGSNYGLNKCLTECRINSIQILCKCLPFYYYDENAFEFERNRENKIKFCTLQHVTCLDKYRFKWINVVTERIKSKELEKEMEDSLFCPQCYALCSNTQLKTSVMSIPIQKATIKSNLLNFISFNKISDLAILKIYFKDSTAKYYKRTLKNFWFEIFSTIGGICGIITGLSLGALCQIIYFIITACKKMYLISIT